MDFSSLHFAVAEPDPKTGRSACNVHVDQVGVLANLAGTPALVPDLGYHAFVELAFRTGLKGLLPGWALQNIDFIMPSSRENYAMNFGVQINYNHSKDLKLSVRGMCAVRDEGNEWSTTFNLSGRHNIWGSKR